MGEGALRYDHTMKILKSLCIGISSILDSCVNPRDYQQPTKDGFRCDHEKLKTDIRKVARGMESVIDRHRDKTYASTPRHNFFIERK